MLPALAEDPSSVPSTHFRTPITAYNSSSRDSVLSSDPHRYPHMHAQHTHIKQNKKATRDYCVDIEGSAAVAWSLNIFLGDSIVTI